MVGIQFQGFAVLGLGLLEDPSCAVGPSQTKMRPRFFGLQFDYFPEENEGGLDPAALQVEIAQIAPGGRLSGSLLYQAAIVTFGAVDFPQVPVLLGQLETGVVVSRVQL